MLETDTITESSDADTDTLDFTQVVPATGVAGITVNLTTTGAQTVTTTGQLRLNLSSATGIENVIGSDTGHDTIRGNSRANTLKGMGGNDSVFGGSGNDTIYGGEGDDTLTGDAGSDSMFGEAGADHFWAGGDGATDTLTGGTGSDVLDSYDNPGDVLADSFP